MEYMKKLKNTFDLDKYTHRLFDQLTLNTKIPVRINGSNDMNSAMLSKQQMESFLGRLEPSLTKAEFESIWTEIDLNGDSFISR
jgi:hypothetical protein